MKISIAKTVVTIPAYTWDKQSPFDQFDREIIFEDGENYALVFFCSRQSNDRNPYKTFKSKRGFIKAFNRERKIYEVEMIDRNGNSLWHHYGELLLSPGEKSFKTEKFDAVSL